MKRKESCYFCIGKDIGPCADAYTEVCGIYNYKEKNKRIVIANSDEEFLKSIKSHEIEDE